MCVLATADQFAKKHMKLRMRMVGHHIQMIHWLIDQEPGGF